MEENRENERKLVGRGGFRVLPTGKQLLLSDSLSVMMMEL